MKVLITGANGFVARNLRQHLAERHDVEMVLFARENAPSDLTTMLEGVDFVFHLAGVNRPQDPQEFVSGNVDLTKKLCTALGELALITGKKVPVVYTSSIQAERDNPYGKSKRAAEEALLSLTRDHRIPVRIFRLPNVFGKWGRPNYNSVVSTFCHNIARGLPIQINDPAAPLSLVYVDDVVAHFLSILDGQFDDNESFCSVSPEYSTTVGDLKAQICAFRDSRQTLVTERVGKGLTRALYATYVSYMLPEHFGYDVPMHGDARGVFVEMLKTPDSGQFSFFTAHPGVTRGGHYHHSKTEKFLVIKGEARFRFRNVLSGDIHELSTSGNQSKIVETTPGWTHDITNIGTDELIVMLWANEIFDRDHPDTYACPL